LEFKGSGGGKVAVFLPQLTLASIVRNGYVQRSIQSPSRGLSEVPASTMDQEHSQSCWGLTTKVMLVIAALMLLTWLIGGNESAALLAKAG